MGEVIKVDFSRREETDEEKFETQIKSIPELADMAPDRIRRLYDIRKIYFNKFRNEFKTLELCVDAIKSRGREHAIKLLKKSGLERIEEDLIRLAEITAALRIVLYQDYHFPDEK